jgi:hypothetical protein
MSGNIYRKVCTNKKQASIYSIHRELCVCVCVGGGGFSQNLGYDPKTGNIVGIALEVRVHTFKRANDVKMYIWIRKYTHTNLCVHR